MDFTPPAVRPSPNQSSQPGSTMRSSPKCKPTCWRLRRIGRCQFLKEVNFFFQMTHARLTRALLVDVVTYSWELGTAAEALTELHTPAISVLRQTAFPPPHVLTPAIGNASAMFSIAQTCVTDFVRCVLFATFFFCFCFSVS